MVLVGATIENSLQKYDFIYTKSPETCENGTFFARQIRSSVHFQFTSFNIPRSPTMNFDEFFHRDRERIEDVPIYPLEEVPYETENTDATEITTESVDS